jgi:signal transduction histidine kinase
MNERLAQLLPVRDPEETSTVRPLNANVSVCPLREVDAVGAGSAANQADEFAHLRKRLRELATDAVDAREAAHAHLAREIHDALGAELTAARFALANLEHLLPATARTASAETLATVQQALDAASEASRRIVEELHVPPLEGGLVATLSHWTRSFARRTALTTSFVCAADMRLKHLPHDAALAIFRVAQEALNNVAKHARASFADVRIETDARYLTLVVKDNGQGMPRGSRRTRAMRTGFGLAGMRARCEAFEGTLRLRSPEPGSTQATPTTRTPATVPPDVAEPRARRARHVTGTEVRARFAWAALIPDAASPTQSGLAVVR